MSLLAWVASEGVRVWVLHAGWTTLEGPADEQILSAVRRTISASHGEIWLEHQQGPILGIVIGGNRAMVLRLAESGDAGFHATLRVKLG